MCGPTTVITPRARSLSGSSPKYTRSPTLNSDTSISFGLTLSTSIPDPLRLCLGRGGRCSALDDRFLDVRVDHQPSCQPLDERLVLLPLQVRVLVRRRCLLGLGVLRTPLLVGLVL